MPTPVMQNFPFHSRTIAMLLDEGFRGYAPELDIFYNVRHIGFIGKPDSRSYFKPLEDEITFRQIVEVIYGVEKIDAQWVLFNRAVFDVNSGETVYDLFPRFSDEDWKEVQVFASESLHSDAKAEFEVLTIVEQLGAIFHFYQGHSDPLLGSTGGEQAGPFQLADITGSRAG